MACDIASGVPWSRSPAITSVGARMVPRRGCSDISRIASQQPSVARRGRQHETIHDARHDVGVRGAERIGEIALGDQVADRGETSLGHRADAVVPHRAAFGAVGARGVGEHEAIEAIGVAQRERLAHHAAHRKAHPVRARDAEAIEQPGRVVRHVVERPRARRQGARAVAARVDRHHAMRRGEGGHEALPHAPVAADGMREQHRGPGAARIGVREVDHAHFFAFLAVFFVAPAAFFAAFFGPRFAFFLAATSAITSRASLKPVLAPGTPT